MWTGFTASFGCSTSMCQYSMRPAAYSKVMAEPALLLASISFAVSRYACSNLGSPSKPAMKRVGNMESDIEPSERSTRRASDLAC